VTDPSSLTESSARTGAPGAAASQARESDRTLWSRVKEHKLIQATLAYLAAALAVAHGEELIASAYRWPELISRLVIGALGIGLPLTLLTVWFATRQRTETDRAAAGRTLDRILLLVLGLIIVALVTERVMSSGHAVPNQLNRLVILALGLLVVALLADRLAAARRIRQSTPANTPATSRRAEPETTSAAPVERLSAATPSRAIAVLPFANLSSDKEQEYFSDGLSEELINHLAHIKGLRVLARTSSFAFKGKSEDLRTIGEKLSVGCVLEGSVRKAGNRLRITAQLVDCADGYHLWSETFDRDLDDVFQIQSDISRSVANALGTALGVAAVEPELAGGTRNVEAYERYLRARSFLARFGPADLQRAIDLYHEALTLDPEFALAWTGLASAYVYTMVFAPELAAQSRREWAHAVERALAIAPELWAAQLAHGWRQAYQHNWSAAHQALNKAVELAPRTESSASFAFGVLLQNVGAMHQAIRQFTVALATDPLSFSVSVQLQWVLATVDRDAEAESEYVRSLDLPGDRSGVEHAALQRAWSAGISSARFKEQMRRFLALDSVHSPFESDLLELTDDAERARKRLHQALHDPACQDATRQFRVSWWAAVFGDVDLALLTLRRAFVDMRWPLLYAIWLPAYGTVRKDARFKIFLRDMKLVDYWRTSGNWGEFARPLGAEEFEVW
jgi:TolB-like protein/Tfp pilus assembly protein PilF